MEAHTCLQPSSVSLTRWSGIIWWIARFLFPSDWACRINIINRGLPILMADWEKRLRCDSIRNFLRDEEAFRGTSIYQLLVIRSSYVCRMTVNDDFRWSLVKFTSRLSQQTLMHITTCEDQTSWENCTGARTQIVRVGALSDYAASPAMAT